MSRGMSNSRSRSRSPIGFQKSAKLIRMEEELNLKQDKIIQQLHEEIRELKINELARGETLEFIRLKVEDYKVKLEIV